MKIKTAAICPSSQAVETFDGRSKVKSNSEEEDTGNNEHATTTRIRKNDDVHQREPRDLCQICLLRRMNKTWMKESGNKETLE